MRACVCVYMCVCVCVKTYIIYLNAFPFSYITTIILNLFIQTVIFMITFCYSPNCYCSSSTTNQYIQESGSFPSTDSAKPPPLSISFLTADSHRAVHLKLERNPDSLLSMAASRGETASSSTVVLQPSCHRLGAPSQPSQLSRLPRDLSVSGQLERGVTRDMV